jgi:hypothetical protein
MSFGQAVSLIVARRIAELIFAAHLPQSLPPA